MTNIKRILGIDPGLASTGFGVIECTGNRYSLVSYGVIETDKDQEHSERLLKIYNGISQIIQEYNPAEASMETLFFSKNVSSAMSVSEARGVITVCLAQNHIPLKQYSPNQIKQSVTGTASADKKLIEQYVKLLLGLKTEPKPDHAADALAGAITHFNFSSSCFS